MRLCRRRTTALLAYLAVEPGPQRRESLLALLWPECGPSRAHAYLRNALWELGKGPVGPWLQTTGDVVDLWSNERIAVDVPAFRTLVSRGKAMADVDSTDDAVHALSSAVALYRGHFLAGFTLPDSPPFDEWQSSQAETLQQQLGVALDRLVRHHLARGEIADAVGLGNRWLALDPLDEDVYSRLMNLYDEAGHPELAMRQYELCEHRLREELRSQPSDATRSHFVQMVESVKQRHADVAAACARPRLPLPPTPFIGRERELEDISRLLDNPQCRLLTLVGYGGSGKTRLAIEAAARWHRATEGHVVLVSLAESRSPLDAVAAIIEALSLQPLANSVGTSGCTSPDLPGLLNRLALWLRRANGLLVLDNVEHLEGFHATIEAMIDGNIGTRLLVTSRRRLGLRGEWILPVEGLKFPSGQCPAGECRTDDAVRLFLDAAQRVNGQFTPDAHDILAIRRVCRLLEGAPLAIELAAGWIRTLSCDEIAAELERGMGFLTAQASGIPMRQRSQRAAFEYSWELLPREAQACFVRLCVFREGFTRSAAREVADTSADILAVLHDCSFIHQISKGRYAVHQVLTQFAEELLEDDPDHSNAIRDRHAKYFLREVARLGPQMETGGQRAALAAFEADAANIAKAWTRGAIRGWYAEVGDAACGLFQYHDMTSRILEGYELFRQAAQGFPTTGGGPSATLSAFLETCMGWFMHATNPTQGRDTMERGVRRMRREPPSRFLGLSLALLGVEAVSRWPSRAERVLTESMRVFESLHDCWGMAVALEGLSFAVVRRDADAAHEFASRSLALRSKCGDRWGIPLALMALGTASRFRGQPKVAREHYGMSLAARLDLGIDRIGIAQCVWNIAATALLEGDYGEAMHRFQDAATRSRDVGDFGLAARCLTSAARAARAAGRIEDARRSLADGLELSIAVGAREEHAGILAEMAALALDNADAAAAQQAAEHALALDRANPCALLAVARNELSEGIRSSAMRTLRAALRSARTRRDDSVIVDIALTLAEIRLSDHYPVDAMTLAKAVLGLHFCYPAPKARAEAVLRRLKVRDGAFRRQAHGDPPAPLADIVAEVMARVRGFPPRAAAIGSSRAHPSALDAGISRHSYRRRTQGREVVKLPAAM